MRESTDRGAAIDISDFERRLRGSEPNNKSPRDPLSELARLMHGEEQNRAAHLYDEVFAAKQPSSRSSEFENWRPQREEDSFAAELRGAFVEAHIQPEDELKSFHDDDQSYGDERASPQFGAQASAGQSHAVGEGDWGDEQAAYLDYGANGKSADVVQPARRRFSLRPWHAVAAIALLASGGIGWSFAHRNGSIGSREIATINAPDGPTKVQPAADAEASVDKPDATVLDRHESTPVKQIVSHQEQAVDPRVEPRAVKLGAGPVNALHEPAAVPGPEPKRVKTVSVRPDGTVIEGAAVPAAVVKATGAQAREAAAKKVSTTPKSPAKPATTPKAEVKAKAKPPQKVAAVEDNAQPAEANSAPAAQKIEKGGFAVQFGAATSEAEAHALVTKVSSKYGAQLGGHHPSFKMAKVGDKTVYRVRIGGISKEAANSVCGKVKSSGGNCFVAGN